MHDGSKSIKQEVSAWGCKTLLSLGYTLKLKQPETIQNTPWSYVARFFTSKGYVYLKSTPSALALEAPILEVMRNRFNVPVPEVIALNKQLNCFLMKDAGQSLRGLLKQAFNKTLIFKAIDQFTLLQCTLEDSVDVFLNMGVPDYSLDKLPELYRQLLSQTDVLMADGLSEGEIKQLESLHSNVSDLCSKLSYYAIKQTMVQPDFNDNNTLIDDTSNKITIIDLGEIVISHPFFSLLNFLHVIKKHHALNETTGPYVEIQAYCFKHFNIDEKNLSDAIGLARVVFFVYTALVNDRLMRACDKTKFTGSFQRQGRISPALRSFIKMCNDM